VFLKNLPKPGLVNLAAIVGHGLQVVLARGKRTAELRELRPDWYETKEAGPES
jgi:hypothetical protein